MTPDIQKIKDFLLNRLFSTVKSSVRKPVDGNDVFAIRRLEDGQEFLHHLYHDKDRWRDADCKRAYMVDTDENNSRLEWLEPVDPELINQAIALLKGFEAAINDNADGTLGDAYEYAFGFISGEKCEQEKQASLIKAKDEEIERKQIALNVLAEEYATLHSENQAKEEEITSLKEKVRNFLAFIHQYAEIPDKYIETYGNLHMNLDAALDNQLTKA